METNNNHAEIILGTYNFRLKSLFLLGLFCVFSATYMKAVELKTIIIEIQWKFFMIVGIGLSCTSLIGWYF